MNKYNFVIEKNGKTLVARKLETYQDINLCIAELKQIEIKKDIMVSKLGLRIGDKLILIRLNYDNSVTIEEDTITNMSGTYFWTEKIPERTTHSLRTKRFGCYHCLLSITEEDKENILKANNLKNMASSRIFYLSDLIKKINSRMIREIKKEQKV